MRRTATLTLLGLAMGCLVGCGIMFAPDPFTKDPVDTERLVGTWVMTPDSLPLLVADGYDDKGLENQIVFHANGTAEFSSVTDLTSPPTHQERTGRWEISNCPVNGETRVKIIAESPDPRRTIFSSAFSSNRKRLRLRDFYGDPDMWEFLEYHKIK